VFLVFAKRDGKWAQTENTNEARMTYSKKPAPAAAVIAQCKGLPVRIVMLQNQRTQLEVWTNVGKWGGG
jgi:hypothetical protein